MWITDHGSLYAGCTKTYYGSGAMTAIQFIYTTEGFLVAADGMKKDNKGNVHSLSAQKIFPVGEPGSATLAYGLAASVQLGRDDDSNEILFDFIKETDRAAADTSTASHADLVSYMKAIADSVNASLQAAINTHADLKLPLTLGKKQADDDPNIIAWAFFGGYFNGTPDYGYIMFRQHSQQLMEPAVGRQDITIGTPFGYLSKPIALGLFHDQDINFNRRVFRLHRTVRTPPAARSLADALQIAASYLAVCRRPEAMQFDEAHCADVGGKIRAATITPSNHFQWLPDSEIQSALAKFETIEL
jgi:hypothetical protein